MERLFAMKASNFPMLMVTILKKLIWEFEHCSQKPSQEVPYLMHDDTDVCQIADKFLITQRIESIMGY
jgi:hypothetical protein